MTTYYSFHAPENPVAAEPETVCLQHPETLRVRKRLEGKKSMMKSRAANEKKEERCPIDRKKIEEIVLNKSSTKMDLFQDDIFRHQKVQVGDCHRWSRYLVVEARRPANISAVTTKEVKPSEMKISTRPTRYFSVEVHLPNGNSAKTAKEVKKETDRGQERRVRGDAQENVCTPLPRVDVDLPELQDLSKAWPNIIQTEDLDESEDIAHLAEDIIKEPEEPKKDKSLTRRCLNWLNDQLQERNMRKIARTYRRELEEGDQIYRTSYMVPRLTRAWSEQRKRRKLMRLEERRLRVKTFLDAHWEVQEQKKEERRVKEEERYEKWAAKHGQSVPDSSPEQPKKRMSKWEKRFLNLFSVVQKMYRGPGPSSSKCYDDVAGRHRVSI